MESNSTLQFIGGLAFGAVVGWTTYFILRRAQPKALTDITTIIGALGGATITGLFTKESVAFVGYAIGLAVGFFVYYIVFLVIVGKHAIREALIKHLQETGGVALGGEPGGGQAVGEVVDWGADKKVKKSKK
jgi:hypothetical protein